MHCTSKAIWCAIMTNEPNFNWNENVCSRDFRSQQKSERMFRYGWIGLDGGWWKHQEEAIQKWSKRVISTCMLYGVGMSIKLAL